MIYSINYIIFIFFVILQITSACAFAQTNEIKVKEINKSNQIPKLSVELHGKILSLHFSNTTDKAIRIDRELIFLITIVPIDFDGNAFDLHEVSALPPIKRKAAQQRFILLKPGDSIKRTIDIDKPFKQLICGVSSPNMSITTYEGLYRLPKDKIINLQVQYGFQYGCREGLEFYIGKDILPADLYEGPLKTEIAIKN